MRNFIETHLTVISQCILIAVGTILITVNLYFGPVSSPDTSTYSAWADLLIEYDFNWINFLQHHVRQAAPHYFYGVPTTIFAIAKILSVDHWKWIIFFLNILCIPIVLLLASKIIFLCEINKYIAALFPLTFLLSSDYPLWPHYILSDTLYVALLMWCIYWVIRSVERMNVSSHIIFITSILLLLLSRPTSPPAVMVLSFFYCFPKLAGLASRNQYLMLWALLLVGALFMIFSGLVVANLSGAINIDQLNFLTSMIKKGLVIHDRPTTFVQFDGSYLSVMKVLWTRFVFFFSPYVDSYSALHIIVNLVFFTMIGTMIIAGEFFSRNVYVSDISSKARGILIFLTIAIAAYHSVTLIDYDFRYRYPVIAPMILLALIGTNNVLRHIKEHKLM